MKETVTVKELLAIIIRRGRTIGCLALVFAFLLGGLQAAKKISAAREDSTPEKLEAQYQEEMEDYLQAKESLEMQLTRAQRKFDELFAYSQKSPLMAIDSYNEAVTTINLAIAVENDMVSWLDGTYIDFITAKIQNQYLAAWNSLDLQAIIEKSLDMSISDQYLREVVLLSQMDGGVLTLMAIGSSEQETKKIAEAVYSYLLENQQTITNGSYPHSLVLLSNETKTALDTKTEEIQQEFFTKFETCQLEIKELTQQLERLSEPKVEEGYSTAGIVKTAVKYMVLGFVLGAVLGIAWVMISCIFSDRIESSYQLEGGLSLRFLGSNTREKGVWHRWANRILGERIWSEEADSCAYLEASSKICLPRNGTVALISTLPILETDPAIRKTVDAIEKQCGVVHFAGDARHNAQAMGIIQSSECVVLAERAGASRWTSVNEAVALAKSMDKPIAGFVMV